MPLWLPKDNDLARAARGWPAPGVKPVGPVEIDWAHPLARGLSSYFPMSPHYGARDIRTPYIVPTFAGGASVTPAGLSLQSADVDYVQVDRSWNLHNTSECTVVVQYILPGVLPNDTTARIIGSDNNFVRINIRNFGGDLIVRGSLFIAGSYRSTGTLNISGAVNKGDVVTLALRFDQPSLNMVGFFEGDQYNTSSQSFGAPIDDDAGGNIIFGAHGSSPAEGTTGTVVACAFYGRKLSDADVESLHADPYRILKPANQAPYLIGVSGGGPAAYELSVTAASVSLTGQSVGLELDRHLDVTAASVSLTGQTVTLTYGQPESYSLDVTPAGVSVDGQTVTLTYATAGNFELNVTPATVSVTGQSVDLDYIRALLLDVTPAGVSVNGQTVTLTYEVPGALELDVTPAALTVAGQTVTLSYNEAACVEAIYAKVLEIWKLLGLDSENPMTVTPTSRTAGDISQTISGDGTTSTTVTRD